MFTVNFANYYISKHYLETLVSEEKQQSLFDVLSYKVSRSRKRT